MTEHDIKQVFSVALEIAIAYVKEGKIAQTIETLTSRRFLTGPDYQLLGDCARMTVLCIEKVKMGLETPDGVLLAKLNQAIEYQQNDGAISMSILKLTHNQRLTENDYRRLTVCAELVTLYVKKVLAEVSDIQ